MGKRIRNGGLHGACRAALPAIAAVVMAAVPDGVIAEKLALRAAAAPVEGSDEPVQGRLRPAPPTRPEAAGPAWSGDLAELLETAGFADAVLLSGRQLKRLGDRLTAGWIAPEGDLFGLLYVVPAEEPGATMRAFVDKVGQDCPGAFDGGVGRLDAVKDRSIGRAAAICRDPGGALHYDMIFYFTPGGTVGITHVGHGATQERARKINNGLMAIFQGL